MSAARGTLRAPSDLAADGRALWRSVHAWLHEMGLILDPHERPLVAELCRTVDRLATARGAIATMTPADPAWARVAGEERQQRLAYGRIVSALGMPSGVVPDADSEKVVGLSPVSRRAQKAAAARWQQRDARRDARAQGVR